MGKTAVLLAPIIVLAATWALCFWLGRRYERTATAVRGTQVNRKLHNQMVEWMWCLLHPSDLADPPYLPATLREEGADLLAQANKNMAKVRRAEQRGAE